MVFLAVKSGAENPLNEEKARIIKDENSAIAGEEETERETKTRVVLSKD